MAFSKESTNTDGETLTVVSLWEFVYVFLESELISCPSHAFLPLSLHMDV